MSARFYGKDHMPDVELLHILVIWAISVKAHKTLLGKAWESNYSAQTLDLQKGGHFNKGGFFCCLWWFLFLSLFTHLLVFYDIFVFFFFFSCVRKYFPEQKAELGGSLAPSLYKCLKMEKHFSCKCAKKKGRKTEGLHFY